MAGREVPARRPTVPSKFLEPLGKFVVTWLGEVYRSGRASSWREPRVLGEAVGVVSDANGDSTASRTRRPFQRSPVRGCCPAATGASWPGPGAVVPPDLAAPRRSLTPCGTTATG